MNDWTKRCADGKLKIAARKVASTIFRRTSAIRDNLSSLQKSEALSMNAPTVSVIIPAYNPGDRLTACIDSLLAQSLRNIEIIIVNDGSDDSTDAISRAYAQCHANIVYIQQSNAGVSHARNRGLAVARGRYIGFCDADDWADERMFERLYDEACRSGVDIAMCKTLRKGQRSETIMSNIPGLPSGRYSRSEMLLRWFKPLIGLVIPAKVHGFVPLCLFRRELLTDHEIRFETSISMHEDALFIAELLAWADGVVFVDEALYHYVHADTSLTTLYFARHEITYQIRLREKVTYHRRLADIAAAGGLAQDVPEALAHCLATWLYYASSLAIVETSPRVFAAVHEIDRKLDAARLPFSAWRSVCFAQLAPFRRIFLALSALRASALIYLLCKMRRPRLG